MNAASAVPAPLAAWLAGLGMSLSETQWASLEAFIGELEAYNAKTNLTADSGEALWTRHIADGLASVAPLKRLLPASPWLLDLGAGGGFVGIALKVAWPEANVTLLESSQRKFRFLNLAAASLGLKGLRVALGRAPQASGVEPQDAVLARALAPLPEAMRLAMPLVKPGGVFAAYASEPAMGEQPDEDFSYRLPGEGKPRHLLFFRRP